MHGLNVAHEDRTTVPRAESLVCDSGSGTRVSRGASETIVGEFDAASVAAKPRATARWGRVVLTAKLTGRAPTMEAET